MQKGFFTVGGHSVLVLDYQEAPGGNELLEYRLKGWIQVDRGFFAFFSRLFLTRSKAVADRQFTRMLKVPVNVTQRAHDEPKIVLAALDGLPESERTRCTELRSLISRERR
jgi:hypothetical protein